MTADSNLQPRWACISRSRLFIFSFVIPLTRGLQKRWIFQMQNVEGKTADLECGNVPSSAQL